MQCTMYVDAPRAAHASSQSESKTESHLARTKRREREVKQFTSRHRVESSMLVGISSCARRDMLNLGDNGGR